MNNTHGERIMVKIFNVLYQAPDFIKEQKKAPAVTTGA